MFVANVEAGEPSSPVLALSVESKSVSAVVSLLGNASSGMSVVYSSPYSCKSELAVEYADDTVYATATPTALPSALENHELLPLEDILNIGRRRFTIRQRKFGRRMVTETFVCFGKAGRGYGNL